MELVYLDYDHRKKINDLLVATIGQFDGLHIAHQQLIERAIQIAKNKNLKSAVVTFDPHPDFVIHENLPTTYITPIDVKIDALQKKGIDYLIVIHFTKEVMMMDRLDFVNSFLLDNGVIEAIVGYDFTFGKNGMGKATDIEQLSGGKIKTTIIEELKYFDKKISTTLIRMLLMEGKVDEVSTLLGHNYTVKGVVVKGKQVGRTIHVPTANLHVTDAIAMIKPGVYVVLVKIDGNKKIGIANLGNNPSFNYSKTMIFETHILEFNETIYDKVLEIELVKYIRSEIQFSSKEAFVNQIKKDIVFAKQVIENIK